MFPERMGSLEKVIPADLPVQRDGYSCGLWISLFVKLVLLGEKPNLMVHTGNYVNDEFQASLVPYLLRQVDTRDRSMLMPSRYPEDPATFVPEKSLEDDEIQVLNRN